MSFLVSYFFKYADATCINFGYEFDQSVDNLPSGLKNITFVWEFDQPLNKLPPLAKVIRI